MITLTFAPVVRSLTCLMMSMGTLILILDGTGLANFLLTIPELKLWSSVTWNNIALNNATESESIQQQQNCLVTLESWEYYLIKNSCRIIVLVMCHANYLQNKEFYVLRSRLLLVPQIIQKVFHCVQ